MTLADREQGAGGRIDANVEIAEQCESAAAPTRVGIRREQGVIENVVDVGADLRGETLAEVEVFVYAEVHAPSAGAPEQIALGVGRIGEDVGADGWEAECGGVPDAVAGFLVVVVAEDGRAIRGLGVEVADSVDRRDADVAGLDRIAIVADPERREASAGLK